MEDFTLATLNEVRKHEGTPYLLSRQTSQDKRVADTYWSIQDRRFARVVVVTQSETPAPWRAAADLVAFSLR